MVDVGEKAWLLRLPSEYRSGALTGCREIATGKRRKPTEVRGRFLGRQRGERHLEPSRDDLRDLPESNAFLCGCVISGAGCRALDGKPEDPGGIQPMHRRPAVLTITDIGR